MDLKILVTNCTDQAISDLLYYQNDVDYREIKQVSDLAHMFNGYGRAAMFKADIDPETGIIDEESVQMEQLIEG